MCFMQKGFEALPVPPRSQHPQPPPPLHPLRAALCNRSIPAAQDMTQCVDTPMGSPVGIRAYARTRIPGYERIRIHICTSPPCAFLALFARSKPAPMPVPSSLRLPERRAHVHG